MSNIRGELFRNDMDLKKGRDLSTVVRDSIRIFMKKYGYRPPCVMLRDGMSTKEFTKYGLEITVVNNHLQENHFLLYPVIRRTARIFKGERKPCLDK